MKTDGKSHPFSLVDFPCGRVEVDLVAGRQTHYGVAGLIEINALDVEEAGGTRAGRVVLLHTVVGAPNFLAVGCAEEGRVTGSVESVAVDEEGFFVLLPVCDVCKRAAHVLEHAEAVVIRPAAVSGIDDEKSALALKKEGTLNDRAAACVGLHKLPVELGAGDGCPIVAVSVGIYKVANVENLTVLWVNTGGAEVLHAVGDGVNGGVDRENIGAWLTAEDPFTLKGIVRRSFHNKETLLTRLGLDAAAGNEPIEFTKFIGSS